MEEMKELMPYILAYYNKEIVKKYAINMDLNR